MGVGPRRKAFLGSSGHPSADLKITEPTTPFSLRSPSTWTCSVQAGVGLGGLASCAVLPAPEAGPISDSTIARCARRVNTKLRRCRWVQGSSGTAQLTGCRSTAIHRAWVGKGIDLLLCPVEAQNSFPKIHQWRLRQDNLLDLYLSLDWGRIRVRCAGKLTGPG